MIIIANKGQAIESTNFYDSEHAAAGFFFLSWNAGAARLLVPDAQKPALREMKTGKFVVISRGPFETGKDMLELMFEDHSDSPFCLHIGVDQCDRLIPETEQGGGFLVSVWTKGGMKLCLPGKYREVDKIPYMREWIEH
jgi:hypothetical protein